MPRALPGKLPAGLSLSQRQSVLPGDSDRTMSYLLPGTEGCPANGNSLPPDSGPCPSCHFHGLSLHALDTLLLKSHRLGAFPRGGVRARPGRPPAFPVGLHPRFPRAGADQEQHGC